MKATEKEKIVIWAVGKMAEVEDVASVERICEWAEQRVKGSNQRKWALWNARETALERLNQ